MYFSEKSTAGEYTKAGENVCPPSKIIYMKYFLILLGRMFLIYKVQTLLKTCFETSKMSVQT